MKKLSTLILLFSLPILCYGQKTLTNLMDASLVIGQSDFTSNLETYNETILNGSSF